MLAPSAGSSPLAGTERLESVGGVPTVHYGPNESVPISELLTVTKALALVALEQCGVG
jgi:hypothetical protein